LENKNNITIENSFTLNLYNSDNTGTRDVSLFELGVASGIPSDVVITEVGSTNYSTILNSQTGGVYFIKGLTIQINQAPDEDSKQRQILKPFRFKKIDVNGNEYEIQKVQVIDPYQYQYAYEWVDLVDDGETYCLDGNTAFRYTLEPLTGINVTFNYVEVKNENFGTEESEITKQNQLKNLNEAESEKDDASLIVLDIDNAVGTKKKTKKNNSIWWLILGATAVFLLINPLKTNQK